MLTPLLETTFRISSAITNIVLHSSSAVDSLLALMRIETIVFSGNFKFTSIILRINDQFFWNNISLHFVISLGSKNSLPVWAMCSLLVMLFPQLLLFLTSELPLSFMLPEVLEVQFSVSMQNLLFLHLSAHLTLMNSINVWYNPSRFVSWIWCFQF